MTTDHQLWKTQAFSVTTLTHSLRRTDGQTGPQSSLFHSMIAAFLPSPEPSSFLPPPLLQCDRSGRTINYPG